MTANDDEATRNEAMDAGCIAYLRKPFAQDALLNAISKAVAQPAQSSRPFGVIRDRVKPAASPTMSALSRKRK
jgi:DNA-binding NarL/FixJ family response regulator